MIGSIKPNSNSPDGSGDIIETLHGQTARIAWADLQRLFAAGKVVSVDASLNLVEVGAAMQADDKTSFQRWTAEKLVAPVTDEQAQFWFAAESSVWAVVVSPWVLVQEPSTRSQ